MIRYTYVNAQGLLSAHCGVILRPPGETTTHPNELIIQVKLDTGAAISYFPDNALIAINGTRIRSQRFSGFGGGFDAPVYAVSLEFAGQVFDFIEVVGGKGQGAVLGMNAMIKSNICFDGLLGVVTIL